MTPRVLLFDADGNDTELEFNAGAIQQPGERQLLWLDIEGQLPPNLAEVVAGLGIEEATLAQLGDDSGQLRRLVQHGKYVTLTARAAHDHAQTFTPLTVVAGENFILTAHHEPIQPLSDFMEQMQGDTKLGKLDSAGFLVVLMSRVLETYFHALSHIEQITDRLDETLLGETQPTREPLNELVALRHRVGLLRRELAAHRPLFMNLASPDFEVYAGDEKEARFMALLDQFQHALDGVGATRDQVNGSFELYMTSLGQRTNDIMRVLTIVTLALGVLAAVAGLMGMNFQADIFKTGNAGFRDVLLGSALIIVALLLLIRWRRWI